MGSRISGRALAGDRIKNRRNVLSKVSLRID
jgi:hypothetical protein